MAFATSAISPQARKPGIMWYRVSGEARMIGRHCQRRELVSKSSATNQSRLLGAAPRVDKDRTWTYVKNALPIPTRGFQPKHSSTSADGPSQQLPSSRVQADPAVVAVALYMAASPTGSLLTLPAICQRLSSRETSARDSNLQLQKQRLWQRHSKNVEKNCSETQANPTLLCH